MDDAISSINNMAGLWYIISVSIECNNVGFALLNRSDHGDDDVLPMALDAFTTALKIMRAVTLTTSSRLEEQPENFSADLKSFATQSLYNVQGRAAALLEQQSQEKERLPSPASSHHPDLEQHESLLIGHPIEISPIPNSDAITLNLVNKKSTILLYNMGLAFLNMSTRPFSAPPQQRANMLKSIALFDMAYQLGYDHTIIDDRCIQRICMESLYYSAQLHHCFAEYDHTERILGKIQDTIRSFPPTDDENELSTRQQFLFLLNFLHTPSGAPAA
jgi:hypothetical protein